MADLRSLALICALATAYDTRVAAIATKCTVNDAVVSEKTIAGHFNLSPLAYPCFEDIEIRTSNSRSKQLKQYIQTKWNGALCVFLLV